jgi:hypothetical protein
LLQSDRSASLSAKTRPVRTIGQWITQGFDVILPDAPNGTSLFGRRHLPAMRTRSAKPSIFGRSAPIGQFG